MCFAAPTIVRETVPVALVRRMFLKRCLDVNVFSVLHSGMCVNVIAWEPLCEEHSGRLVFALTVIENDRKRPPSADEVALVKFAFKPYRFRPIDGENDESVFLETIHED